MEYVLLHRPLVDVPEEADAVVAEHAVRGDAVDACVHHVDEVEVAYIDVRKVSRHLFLKEPVEVHPLGGVGCAAGSEEVFVHARVRVVAVIPPTIG